MHVFLNVDLVIGMYTAFNKGTLINPEDSVLPYNLNPFLTPPLYDEEEDMMNHQTIHLTL